MTEQGMIQHLPTGAWWIDTGEVTYCVSSINAHCTQKLQTLHDAHKPVYITLERITEYASDELRTRIHPEQGDWDADRDVYCLVREVPISYGYEAHNGTQNGTDDDPEQLVLDAFFELVEDGIFEIHIEEK